MSPADDEHVSGLGAPSAELEWRAAQEERDDRDESDHGDHMGAHAQRVDVPPIAAPRHPLADRHRYFLSSFEPSGEFDAVIVAVTDDGRRRYFTTRDGASLDEVDEVSFERRRESGTRSMIELDERELGELEVELHFVRAVRGRDPIAEAEAAAASRSMNTRTPMTMRCRMPRTRQRRPKRTSTTSRSHTARPGRRSRPRVRRSKRKRMKRRSTGWTIG